MSAHTPGPWVLNGWDVVQRGCTDTFPSLAAIHNADGSLCMEEINANATLIAAAPDLLAACKCALADLEGILPDFDPEGHPEWVGAGKGHSGWQTITQLMAAIAKAERGTGQCAPTVE